MEWSELQEQFELGGIETIEWLENEYNKIRSGRVNPAIFDCVRVEAYGDFLPLNQLSNLQIIDATQVLIKPYDRSQLQAIAKAITQSTLNVTPQVNADNVRIVFPAQTEENRLNNVKKAKEILEQAKIKLRDVRKEVQSRFKKLENVSEDLIHYFEDELDKITKSYNLKLEDIFNKKQAELMKM